MPELTWFEELALALYHTKTYIVTVGPRSKEGKTVGGDPKKRVRAILGHTLAFEQDPDQLMAHLTAWCDLLDINNTSDWGPIGTAMEPLSLEAIFTVITLRLQERIDELCRAGGLVAFRQTLREPWY